MKYYSQKKYTIITNTSRVIAALIMAAPLMWEGIDDVITSFYIEYGTLRTAITREIFKILIYFLLQIIIILDGLSFSNVYSKNNFDLTCPLSKMFKHSSTEFSDTKISDTLSSQINQHTSPTNEVQNTYPLQLMNSSN